MMRQWVTFNVTEAKKVARVITAPYIRTVLLKTDSLFESNQVFSGTRNTLTFRSGCFKGFNVMALLSGDTFVEDQKLW